MSNIDSRRLNDAQLDADLSVLGDEGQGEPKMPRLGDAPAPAAPDGLSRDTDSDASNAVSVDDQRIASEAARDVVDGYGKG